jgi:group I intron endonuclease
MIVKIEKFNTFIIIITMINNIGYIYEYTNKINNKKYIGQTWNINKRINQHKNGYGYAKLLKYAIQKYGIYNFNIRILFKTENQSILNNVEIISIRLSSSLTPNGYNIDLGGSHGKKSDETKKLIGSYHKNKFVSLETKNKISEKLKNIKKSQETKKLISHNTKKYHEEKIKYIYIFNCITHNIIEKYNNIKLASDKMNISINKIYGSISAKSKFKYKDIYCYASYNNIQIKKDFKIGTEVRIIRKDGLKIDYNSIIDATIKLKINRNTISELIRNKSKWSSYIDDDDNKIYFTAKYI